MSRAGSIRLALPWGAVALLGTLTGCATAADVVTVPEAVDARYRDGSYRADGSDRTSTRSTSPWWQGRRSPPPGSARRWRPSRRRPSRA